MPVIKANIIYACDDAFVCWYVEKGDFCTRLVIVKAWADIGFLPGGDGIRSQIRQLGTKGQTGQFL
tara:strand:- start:759 stop:956 length:198 start_codon:yes stop_codon:yes gene_type:complete